MRAAALALGVCAALAAGQAAHAAKRAPPEPQKWIPPVPLTSRIQVRTRDCDEKHAPNSEDGTPGLKASWNGKGALRLRGLLYHGGDERLAAADVSAWQVGDRIVVAYRLKSDPFPEAPTLMCPGFTHLDISFPPLRARPREITVYSGRLQYTDEPDSVVVPAK